MLSFRPSLAAILHKIGRIDMDADRKKALQDQIAHAEAFPRRHRPQLDTNVVRDRNTELRLCRVLGRGTGHI